MNNIRSYHRSITNSTCLGSTMVGEIWDQLVQVKELKGLLTVLSLWRQFLQAEALKGVSMIEHILNLRQMQEELNNLQANVSNLDFSLTLITSLPESWDMFTSTLLASKGSNLKTKITSTKLVSILLKEE